MTNSAIADNFSLLGKLMDIHGDNSFKARSYSVAAFTIDKLPVELSTLSFEKIASIKGIGDSIAKRVEEQIKTQQLVALTEYIEKTPPGIIEMLLHIKGLGPKKIATIWKEMEIETVGELLYACNENRLTLFKGFGEKTQQSVKESIEFYLNNVGSYLWQQVETYYEALNEKLLELFPDKSFIVTGAFRRQLEIIEQLEWVTTTESNELSSFFTVNNYKIETETENYISFRGPENICLGFHLATDDNLMATLFSTSCSEEFYNAWNEQSNWDAGESYETEETIFETYQIQYIPPFQRETAAIIFKAADGNLSPVIQPTDICGIIHSHSKWSDGSNTLAEMSLAAKKQGLEYLVISDHSKTASYAKGLEVERVLAQHKEIEELNTQLAPFKIFKSIESDILGDGSLDYEPEILGKFDLVIASVHSNLKMTEDKAMMRLMKAIENPYTSILGHMTGRLLLSRNGYPIDHQAIIEACAKHNVVIELNAHPRRLDIDWRWIEYALSKNVLISINPDAHAIEGYADCKYGVLVAQKAGLTKEQNLSSFNLTQFENFVLRQHLKRQ